MVALPGADPSRLARVLDDLSSRTEGAFGVNFLMPFIDRNSVEVAAHRARVVEFFYGNPDEQLVSVAHSGGALASWQVGSVGEAQAAIDIGCDLIVVQGVEAGGHVRGEVGLLSLLGQVIDLVEVPVIAAGGLGSARSIAGVLTAGAAAVRLGTRFLGAIEADVHPKYLRSLIAARAEDTVITTMFSEQWPDAPHRVLRACIEQARSIEDSPIGAVEIDGIGRISVPRFSPLPPGRTSSGHVEAMAQYAGESVGELRREQPAREIIRELIDGAEIYLRKAQSLVVPNL